MKFKKFNYRVKIEVIDYSEKTTGWNARFGDGAIYLGVTFYKSLYNKYIIPMPIETILGSEGKEFKPCLAKQDPKSLKSDL